MIINNKTNLYRRIAGTFLIFSLLVALAVFYFSFSWATVVIRPFAESFSTTQIFSLTDKDTHSPDEVKAVIQSETLNASGQFDISSEKEVVGKLTGTITLVNNTATEQPLRSTTRLLSANDILFRMKDYATVPAHGQVVVDVYADLDGDIGKIDDSRFTIPGLWAGLQTQIYGQGFVQKEPATRMIKVVQKEDLDSAKKVLLDRLQTNFQQKLITPNGNRGVYQAIDSKIINEEFSAKEGDETATLDVTVQALFVAISFDRQVVYDRVVENLKGEIGSNQELIPPDPSDFEYNVTMKGSDLSQMQLRVSGQASKVTTQDSRLFDSQALVGKSHADIIAYFSNFDDIDTVKVSLYPFWVFRAPALSDHINILLDTR